MRRLIIVMIAVLLFTSSSYCLFQSSEASQKNVIFNNQKLMVDVYTDKDPSGKGINETSDAFSPLELIVLHAYVAYNGYPVANIHVVFFIEGPLDQQNKFNFSISGITNSSGVASASFRIPWPSEEEYTPFGVWLVTATAKVGEIVAQDYLTFKIGWIIEILSINLLNENGVSTTIFSLGERIDVKVLLKNLALSQKEVSIVVNLWDRSKRLINKTSVSKYQIAPNSTESVILKCSIPTWSALGTAILDVTAYSASPETGGVPYSPSLHKEFQIVTHDVAILNVDVSPLVVELGEKINIELKIANEGNFTENFEVYVFYDTTLIKKLNVTLTSGSSTTIRIEWNTINVSPGNYRISASIPPLTGEVDTDDNQLTYEKEVTILLPPPPPVVIDVAIKSVEPNTTEAYIGEIINFKVTVRNEGNVSVSFNVSLYYNNTLIDILNVPILSPRATETFNIIWNTSDISEGKYQITAIIEPLPDEYDVEDNQYVNGIITLKHMEYYLYPLWILLVVILLLFLVISLIYLRKRRRKKKRLERTVAAISLKLIDSFHNIQFLNPIMFMMKEKFVN